MQYKIGEVAKLLNISTTTIRFYEQQNLFPKIKRNANGIRVFDDEDIEFLKTIQCLKRSNMSIQAIQKILDYIAEGDKTITQRLELFKEQREILRKQIENLQMTLKFVEYKCSYYEKAQKLGSTATLENVPIDEIFKQ